MATDSVVSTLHRTRELATKRPSENRHHCNIVLANACSISNKWGELGEVCHSARVDIAGITESWLSECFRSDAVQPSGYSCYRCDRQSQNGGGGVLLLVSLYLEHMEGTCLNTPNIQALECSIRNPTWNGSVILVYRSPSAVEAEDSLLLGWVKQVVKSAHGVVLMGDFNVPEVDWVYDVATPGSFGARLLDLAEELGLLQHVDQPTRFRHGQQPSLLDLIFTRYLAEVSNVTVDCPLGKSDHGLIRFQLGMSAALKERGLKRKFQSIKLEQLVSMAERMRWDISPLRSMGENWIHFKNNILEITDVVAPLRPTSKLRRKPWMKARALKALRKKRTAFNTYRSHPTHRNWRCYLHLRKSAASVLNDCREKYEERLAVNAKQNPKAFFKCVQSKKALRKETAVLTGDRGEEIVEDSQLAEEFARYFKRVLRIDRCSPLPEFGDRPVCTALEIGGIEREEVLDALKSLRADKSAGPDGLHPAVLKPIASTIAGPLAILFNQSLQSGEIVPDWREARVVPIHKSGPLNNKANYRPISLTSVILKTLERILRNRIAGYLVSNNLLCPQQHGFVKRRSCLTNLLSFLDEVTRKLDDGEIVEVCYFDFSKAFDSVNHRFLLHKLAGYGVPKTLCSWVRAFLWDRTFHVVVRDALSANVVVTSGVPQGSVLGPLLFVVYINDLAEKLSGKSFIYADDLKVVTTSPEMLARDLETVREWSHTWDLPLNNDKCAVLSSNTDTDEGDTPARVKSAKDLGVIVRNDFKSGDQCRAAANKAKRALFQIRGSVKSRKAKVLLPLYKAIVRPHLEYCVQAWAPDLKKDKALLERIQRLATRRIKECKGLEYPQRLQSLQLFSLERRRTRGDLIEIFKILKGYTGLNAGDLFEVTDVRRVRGHCLKLGKVRPRLNLRANAFALRSINHWNSLPGNVVEANSVVDFKKRLDAAWDSTFPNLH